LIRPSRNWTVSTEIHPQKKLASGSGKEQKLASHEGQTRNRQEDEESGNEYSRLANSLPEMRLRGAMEQIWQQEIHFWPLRSMQAHSFSRR
jgi:hypothetical protein